MPNSGLTFCIRRLSDLANLKAACFFLPSSATFFCRETDRLLASSGTAHRKLILKRRAVLRMVSGVRSFI